MYHVVLRLEIAAFVNMNRRADLIEIGVRLESCADEKKRGFYLVFLRVAFFLRRFACLYMFAIFFSYFFTSFVLFGCVFTSISIEPK